MASTKDSMSNALNHNANVLMERGGHTKSLCQLGKLLGLAGMVGSALAIGTDNIEAGATGLAISGGLYLSGALKEFETTGGLRPFPFFSADVGTIARTASTNGEKVGKVTELDYLNSAEKAELAMSTTLKPLTMALDRLPPGEQTPAFHMLINGLQAMHPDAVENVGMLPALLPEMGGMRGVQNDLGDVLPPAHQKTFKSAEVPAGDFKIAGADDPALKAITAHAELAPEPTAQYFPGQTQQATSQHSGQSNPMAQQVRNSRQVEPRQVERKPQERSDRSFAPEQVSVNALRELVAGPALSRAWFGGQRTGKSYLAAVASGEISKKFNMRVFHINLASFGTEDDYYWSHVQPSDRVCCDITEMDPATANVEIDKAVRLVNEFYTCKGAALLILDELAYAGAKVNRHSDNLAQLMHVMADKIAVISSTGMKRGKALWTLAPEFVAEALQRDALAVKKLSPVMCAIAPGHKACWKDQFGEPHELSFDWSLYTMVRNNKFKITDPPEYSQHARIVHVNGQWMSAGVDGTELTG